jgi:hypothetical protein
MGERSKLPPTPKQLERVEQLIEHEALAPHLDKIMQNFEGKIRTRGATGVMLKWMKEEIQRYENRVLFFLIFDDLSFGKGCEESLNLLHSLILGYLLPAGKVQSVHAADGVREFPGFIHRFDDTFIIQNGVTVHVNKRDAFYVERLHGSGLHDLHGFSQKVVQPGSVGAAGIVVVDYVRVHGGDDLSYPLSGDLVVVGDFTHGGTCGVLLADHTVSCFKLLGHRPPTWNKCKCSKVTNNLMTRASVRQALLPLLTGEDHDHSR